MFELFGLTEGTLEVRTRGWALLQLLSGFFSIILGHIQLTVWTSRIKIKTDPFFTYDIQNISPSGCISFNPIFNLPKFHEISGPVVPKYDATMNVFLGGGFFIMGIVLLLAVDQKSVRKCTIWLAASTFMFILIVTDGLVYFYMKPSITQLTKLPLWAAFCYSAHVVRNYRLQVIQFQLQQSSADAVKESDSDSDSFSD